MMCAVREFRIGPNAVTQVAVALERRLGRSFSGDLMRAAGLGSYLDAPPQQMIVEREVIALHHTMRERLQPATATEIARAAGLATGDYLLAHRIPGLAQRALRLLPARFAGRLLLRAITLHAWTFAGSGQFAATAGHPIVITIAECPICRGAESRYPLCEYYAATFSRLFTRLVHRRARVRETACHAAGAPACRFEIDWHGR